MGASKDLPMFDAFLFVPKLLLRCSAVLLGTAVVAVPALAQKPYPIFTAEHLAVTMETLGPNFVATIEAISAANHTTAKERLSRSREQLATTITFWRSYEKDNAIRSVRAALATMDELDSILSEERVDVEKVRSAVDEIKSACASCHDVYRERDAVTGEYRLKMETVQ